MFSGQGSAVTQDMLAHGCLSLARLWRKFDDEGGEPEAWSWVLRHTYLLGNAGKPCGIAMTHTHTAAGLLDSSGSSPPLLSSNQLIMLLTWGFFWQTLLELPVLTRKPSWPMFLASTTPSQEPRRYRRIPSSLHRAHLVPLLMSKPFFFLSLLSSYGHLYYYVLGRVGCWFKVVPQIKYTGQGSQEFCFPLVRSTSSGS